MSIVVKTDTKHRFGVKVTLPGVGLKQPDAEGKFEHDNEEEIRELIYHFSDFYIESEGPIVPEGAFDELGEKSESDELNKKAPEVEQLSAEEIDELKKAQEEADQIAADEAARLEALANEGMLTQEEKAAIIEALPTMSRKELEDNCKPFPGKEWRGKNKEELIAYLIDKLK